LSSLQQARQKAQPTVIVKKRFPHSGILGRLKSLGVITSFHEENKVLLVRLNLKSFVKIKALSLPLSSRDIKFDKKRQGGAFVSIINTDRGLLTSTELVEQNIGGRVVISIS
jgi:ribosomal protein S8